MINKNDLNIKITNEIFSSYTRQGFGRLLKSEIDLLMFDFSLKLIFLELEKDYFVDDELNYFLINKQDIYELSKRLKITETKIIGYIEQIGLLKGLLNDDIALKYFWKLLKSKKQDENYLSDGYIVCYVPNKLMKSFIEAKVDAIGKIPDYLENKDIIKFKLNAIFEIYGKNENDFVLWLKNINQTKKDKDLKIILDKIQQDNINIKNKDILKTISSKFVGKSSDIMIDSLFDILLGDIDVD